MRKGFKPLFALVLAASLIIESIPVNAFAEIDAVGILKDEENGYRIESDAEYLEGQAIVLYSNSSTFIKSAGISIESGISMGSGFFTGSEIEIIETYDFDISKSRTIRAQSNKTVEDGNFSISLVKSDKYSTEELIEKLSSKKGVKFVEPNYKISKQDTNDTYSAHQWALYNKGQNHGTEGLDINIDEALFDVGNDDQKVIALLDSGIDYTHEDLQNSIWNNPYNRNELDGQHGYDFINDDDDPMDDYGHGTHCAGIMLAERNNNLGIAGVADNKNIKLMALKVIDEFGIGYNDEVIGAYNYIYKAQQLGIDVVAINNSWEGDESSEIIATLIDLVGRNGAVSVFAAGNNSSDNDAIGAFPSGIDSPYIISVAASTEKDELAAFSSYGKQSVDIAAPGTSILSTVSYDCFNPILYAPEEGLYSKFTSFEKGNLVQVIENDRYIDVDVDENSDTYGITSYGLADVTVELSDEEFFGANKGSSLKWSVSNAGIGEIYYLYLPYTAKVSDTPLYSAAAVKAKGPESMAELEAIVGAPSMVAVIDSTISGNGEYNEPTDVLLGGTFISGEENYWTFCSGAVMESNNHQQERVIAIQLLTITPGDYTVYIDGVGTSKENVASTQFGKYDFMSGTSMAAPHVTAAIAVAASTYDYDDILEIKTRILRSSRKSDSFADKIKTGGVLDLSDLSYVEPPVENTTTETGEVATTAPETPTDRETITAPEEPTDRETATAPKGTTDQPTTAQNKTAGQESTTSLKETKPLDSATTKNTLGKAKKPDVKRAKNNAKAKLTLKKVRGAKGYQIKYATTKKFKKKTTKTVTTVKLKKTIKKLKKTKKYYIKVRAYKVVKGKKVYGKWSNVKVMKVNKS